MRSHTTMPARRRTKGVLAATVLAMLTVAVAPVSGAMAAPDVPDLIVGGPLSAERVSVPKAATSRLAQSDPSVLEATGTEPTAVVVKLDYDALATYAGDLPGYEATSPSVTNAPFDRGSQAHAGTRPLSRASRVTSSLHCKRQFPAPWSAPNCASSMAASL